MKKFILPFLFFTFLTAPVFADTQYLSSLPDIPLMPEMREIQDSDINFDKAEGRIVQEAVKAQNITPQQVTQFYNRSLPALGWTPVSSTANASRFSRNGEQLIVNLDKLADEGLVRFAVSPNQH